MSIEEILLQFTNYILTDGEPKLNTEQAKKKLQDLFCEMIDEERPDMSYISSDIKMAQAIAVSKVLDKLKAKIKGK